MIDFRRSLHQNLGVSSTDLRTPTIPPPINQARSTKRDQPTALRVVDIRGFAARQRTHPNPKRKRGTHNPCSCFIRAHAFSSNIPIGSLPQPFEICHHTFLACLRLNQVRQGNLGSKGLASLRPVNFDSNLMTWNHTSNVSSQDKQLGQPIYLLMRMSLFASLSVVNGSIVEYTHR